MRNRLLQHGADLSLKSNSGKTALDLATQPGGRPEAAAVLSAWVANAQSNGATATIAETQQREATEGETQQAEVQQVVAQVPGDQGYPVKAAMPVSLR